MGQEAPVARLSLHARYQRDSLLPKRQCACRSCVAAGFCSEYADLHFGNYRAGAFRVRQSERTGRVTDRRFAVTVSIIAVDSRIARLAALARKSDALKVPDSVIAATAMFTGSTLITRNTRDFRRVQNLSVLKI